MRILIDILHPAHVHFFRNFHAEMTASGHELCITARVKECTTNLLDRFALPYQVLSHQRPGLALAGELIQRTYRLTSVIRRFQPDVLTGIMGPSIALGGMLCGVPAVVFYDTEFATQTNWFVYPLADSVCTPDCYRGRVRGRHRTYAGYHELAYLHPNRFEPDPAKLDDFGVLSGELYSVVRFVSLGAVHDRSERGLTEPRKRMLVQSLAQYGKVLISSEAPLPDDLEHLRLRGPVENVHHLLAGAQMLVGESATMASEAAVLGVPAVYIATTPRGYTDDQERRYGLVRYFPEQRFSDAMAAVHELFARESPRAFGARARQQLLNDKIDVTRWMVDYFHDRFQAPRARRR